MKEIICNFSSKTTALIKNNNNYSISSKTTSIGIRFRDDQVTSKKFPCLTFCPWPAFRKRGFYYNDKMLKENTFDLEDVFQNTTVVELNNKTLYDVKELKNYMTGRCFIVCPLRKYSKVEPVTFLLKKSWDINLYVHAKEDAFWFMLSNFPTLMAQTLLPIQRKEGSSIEMLLLSESEVTTRNQDSSKCKMYEKNENPHSEFISCSKTYFGSILRPILNCLLPGFEDLLPEKELKECSNLAEGLNATENFDNVKWASNQNLDLMCPHPCLQKGYNLKIEFMHRNTWIDSRNFFGEQVINSTYLLNVAFESLLVEEKVEALVYDGVSFVAAAGGNLGLFIGFSCFSVLIALVKLFKKKILK